MIVAILLAAAGGAYAWYPPFRLFTWVAAGRSPDCPLVQALQSDRNAQLERAAADRIAGASKLISLDGHGLELWQTPQGRFWVPERSRKLLPVLLAEQERGIYGSGDAGPRAGDVLVDWSPGFGATVNEELLAGAGKVIAIETVPENVECLRRNFSSEIATGRVVLYAGDSQTTVDSVVAEMKPSRLDYIKFDLDGGAPKPIEGARSAIAQYKPRISVATYRHPDHPRRVEQIVRAIRSDYQVRCGPCASVQEAHSIRPDVLYFK